MRNVPNVWLTTCWQKKLYRNGTPVAFSVATSAFSVSRVATSSTLSPLRGWGGPGVWGSYDHQGCVCAAGRRFHRRLLAEMEDRDLGKLLWRNCRRCLGTMMMSIYAVYPISRDQLDKRRLPSQYVLVLGVLWERKAFRSFQKSNRGQCHVLTPMDCRIWLPTL